MSKHLCTPAYAAKRLGVSKRRVYYLISRGRLPAKKLKGGGYIIDLRDLK